MGTFLTSLWDCAAFSSSVNSVGAPLSGHLSDRAIIVWRERRGGVWVPEDRLRAAIWGAAFCVPVSTLGAGLTTALFLVGKALIGAYLGRSSYGSAYGAAGSLVILLVWVYYSAQILFFGAEFTKVYADQFGSTIRPARDAEPVTEQSRAQQGIPRKHGLA